ncbi:MAG: hypothetical protein LKJ36_00865 [Lactobacillus sp.]|jgi:hypothetical protein|nr:hypothetical protein [Lactobacillus sp.]MCI1973318.1 hypothetical protein [Lactobacillus sp.]
MKRNTVILGLVLGLMLLATGCQNSAHSQHPKVYPVKTTRVKIKDDGSFEVAGTTKAPTNAVVMAEYQYPASRSKHVNKAYPSDDADYRKLNYPRVRHHKFTVILNANNELKAGQKIKVTMFAVNGYGNFINPNKFSLDKIPAKILRAADKANIQPIHLKVTPAVVKRYPTVPIT